MKTKSLNPAAPTTRLSLMLLALSIPAAHPETWTGGGTNNRWDNADNWGGSAAPDAVDAVADLTFDAGDGTAQPTGSSFIDMTGDWTIGTLKFEDTNTATPYDIYLSNQGSLTFDVSSGTAIINVVNGRLDVRTETIFNDTVVKTGAGELQQNGNNPSIFSGVGGLTVDGGLVVLNRSNTYQGLTTINNGGTIRLGNNDGLGSTTAGTTVNSGGILDVNGQTIGEAITLNGGSIQNSGGTATMNGAITLDADSTFDLAGRVDLFGGIDLAGNTLITGGNQLVLRGTDPTVVTDGNIRIDSGTLTLQDGIQVQGTGTIELNGGRITTWNLTSGNITRDILVSADNSEIRFLTESHNIGSDIELGTNSLALDAVYGGRTYGITGVISGSGDIEIGANAGTMLFTGDNIYTGETTLLSGSNNASLAIGDGGSLGTGNVTLQTGTSLTYNRSNTTPVSNNILANGTLTHGGTGFLDLNGNITGSGSIVKATGSGSLALDGTNTFSGTIDAQGGNLFIRGGGSTYSGDISVASGAELDFGYTGSAPAGNITVSSVISGDGAVDIQNNFSSGETDRIIFTGDNTYTGGTTIGLHDILQVGNGGGTGSLGTGSVSITGQLDFNRNNTNSLDNNITLNGTLRQLGTGGLSLDETISGSGDIVKSGAGFLRLNGVNNFDGDFDLQNGSTFINGAGSTYSGNFVLASGAELDFGLSSGIGNVTVSGVISGNGGEVDININGGDDTDRVIFTGNNTYTGGTDIGGNDILQVGNNTATGTLGNGGVVNISSTATLIFDRTGSYNASNAIQTGGGSVINQGSGDLTLSGVISENGGTITQNGTGTLTLSGANSYTGATQVLAGELFIDGNQSAATGAVSIADGATLGGSGIVGGATTIASGGTHAAGNSPGVQTFTNGITYDSNSIFEWELDVTQTAPEANRGVAYDGVNSDTVGGSGSIFSIALTGTETFADSFWTTDRFWTDIFSSEDGSTPVSGWASTFSGLEYSNASGSISPDGFGSFSLSGNSLTWTAVPEPSSALVGILIGAGLCRRRRTA